MTEQEYKDFKEKTEDKFNDINRNNPGVYTMLMVGLPSRRETICYRSCNSHFTKYLPLWEVNIMLERSEYDEGKYSCALFNVYKRIEKHLKAYKVDITADTFKKADSNEL